MHKIFSGKQVIKAGERFLEDSILDDQQSFENAYEILSYWRFSHEHALDDCYKTAVETSKRHSKNSIFAKRLKRFSSIVLKLRRFPDMKLKNMQDIGGCRVIVSNQKKLYRIVKDLKNKQQFKDSNGRSKYKDYIKSPKDDGYRGYHLIGKFGEGERKRSIEVQLRTNIQHSWATTLEIVDLFTGQALKSNLGREEWIDFFSNTSTQFSIMESISSFENFPPEKQFQLYAKKLFSLGNEAINSCELVQYYEIKLRVSKQLNAFANSLKIVDNTIRDDHLDGYILIEMDTDEASLQTTVFNKEQNELAEKNYAEAEKKAADYPEVVVALVSTDSIGGIKSAYPNYFADSTEFLKHLEFIQSVDTDTKKAIKQQLLEKIKGKMHQL